MNNTHKKRITGLVSGVVVGLLLAGSVFAVVGYIRTPSDINLDVPVGTSMSFDVSNVLTTHTGANSYIISFASGDAVGYFSPCCGTDDAVWATTGIPVGVYSDVYINLYGETECAGYQSSELQEHADSPDYLFSVIPPSPSYIPVDPNLPTDMLAYAGILFTDLGSLIIMAVGVPLGFVVIKRVIGLVKTK